MEAWHGGERFESYVEKTKVMVCCKVVGNAEETGKWPCGVCRKGVGRNSIECSVCRKWVHKKCRCCW